MELVELFQGEERRGEYEKIYEGNGIRYKELKEELAEAICKELDPIQKKRKELERKPEEVDRIIKEGAEKARQIAKETLKEVKEKMGLRGGL
jgi:tryptophanyl-tRNA synthetase